MVQGLDPLGPLSAVLRWETNVDRLNVNSASALHLISTQRSDTPEKFELLGEVRSLCFIRVCRSSLSHDSA